MTHPFRISTLVACLSMALAGCAPTAPAPSPAPDPEPALAAAAVAPEAPAVTGQQMTPPNALEAQCLDEVRRASGAARAIIISSDFAEDATTVVVGAGLPLVNWRCSFANGALSGVARE